MPPILSLEEQETHANMTAENRHIWYLYIDDPVMQKRFEDAGATITEVEPDGLGKHYSIPYKQFKPYKARPKLSQEEAQKRTRNMQEGLRASIESKSVDLRNDSGTEAKE